MVKKLKTQLQRQGQHAKRLRNHPFVVPVATFLVLFFCSLVLFVVAGGTRVGPSDSHIINLYVDGKSQTLPSRAKTVGELLERANISLAEHDVVEPAADAQITDDNFSINVYRAHPVTIIDSADGKKVATYTAQQTPTAIAKQAGLALFPEDKVEAVQTDALTDGIEQKIVVDRATPVQLSLFGTPITTRTQGNTVGELLAEKNIKLESSDTVTPAASTPISAGMQIFVLAEGKHIAAVEEPIAIPEQSVSDPSLPLGTNTVKQEGTAGRKVTTYEVQLDAANKEIGRRVIQEIVTSQPVPRVIAKGTKLVDNRIAGDKSALLLAAGVPYDQLAAADFVIARESGWNLASRSSNGCYGLGQACPGAKLVSACPNWANDANCQIRFFSGYAQRYGGWNGAYNFWVANHWW